VAELEGPYEIYEWEDGRTETWTVNTWEEGELEIELRTRPGTKVVPVVRLHLSEEEKPLAPHYWDMTSKRLCAQLRGILNPPGLAPTRISITAIGSGAQVHFSVTRIPRSPS
jgi:hypothetical protein